MTQADEELMPENRIAGFVSEHVQDQLLRCLIASRLESWSQMTLDRYDDRQNCAALRTETARQVLVIGSGALENTVLLTGMM